MKKTASPAIRVSVIVIIFLAVAVVVFVQISKSKGVSSNSSDKTIILNIESNSMEGKHGFSAGDVISIDKVTEEQAKCLQVGQVITFTVTVQGSDIYMTHRIVGVYLENGVRNYITRGDNETEIDEGYKNYSDVIGVWNNWNTTEADNKEVDGVQPELKTIDELAKAENSSRPLAGKKLPNLGGDFNGID